MQKSKEEIAVLKNKIKILQKQNARLRKIILKIKQVVIDYNN
ncbi:hypothetical protein CBC_0672 [Clostridium botulinum C str. Eklund]|nr:hypothetical protein CBC_0672 [Clostridium botulinum C str. Eklund]